MRKTIFLIILIFSSSLVYAATKGPMATVVLKKGYTKGAGFGSGTAQFYRIALATNCSKRKKIKRFSLITGKTSEKKIPASKKVCLSADTNIYTGSITTKSGQTTRKCINIVSFTPVENEKYIVKQTAIPYQNCTMEILIESTGEAPADLEVIDPE